MCQVKVLRPVDRLVSIPVDIAIYCKTCRNVTNSPLWTLRQMRKRICPAPDHTGRSAAQRSRFGSGFAVALFRLSIWR